MTKAGALLGEAIEKGLVIDSAETFRAKLNEKIREARVALLAHRVFADRKRVLSAFLSVQYFYREGKFVVPKVRNFDKPIWDATLGTILEKNKAHLKDADTIQGLVGAIKAHLRTGAIFDMPDPLDPSDPEKKKTMGYLIDSVDTRCLHEMVEMLSLIGEGRD